jgi:pimeloyl-ACP methyl ester carboxylesterase
MTANQAALTAMALCVLIVSGCGNQTATPLAGPAKPAAPVEGAPRIVNSGDGVHIEYHVYGQGDPAIVLVHGWSCDSNYWRSQLADLKARHTVITLDLAGHGASGRNRTVWSIGNYGEDVASVVRQIPNRQVILVGHSMGGPVALEATQRIGDRVIGVVGVETFKTIGIAPPSREQLDQLVDPFRKDFIGHTRSFVTEYFFQKNADPQFVRKVADDMALSPPEVAVPSILSLFEMDYPSVLQTIHVPVYAINSNLGGVTDEKRIRKTVPTFRAITLTGVGHFMMMEDPKRFNEALLKAIEEIQAPVAQTAANEH